MIERLILSAAALAVAAHGLWVIWRHYARLCPGPALMRARMAPKPPPSWPVRAFAALAPTVSDWLASFAAPSAEARALRQRFYAWWLMWGSTLAAAASAWAIGIGASDPAFLTRLAALAMVGLTHHWFDNHFRALGD